jgi:hypothetical protein
MSWYPSTGSMKPGASYVYEQVDGITYARELGADPSTRKVIGYTENLDRLGKNQESTILGIPTKKVVEMIDIFNAAEHNPALQEALNRAKVLYYLSKEDGNSKT